MQVIILKKETSFNAQRLMHKGISETLMILIFAARWRACRQIPKTDFDGGVLSFAFWFVIGQYEIILIFSCEHVTICRLYAYIQTHT